ncbi:MAG: pyridoxamine 5'-phosphate oxidase family protein [Litoreibacter sp.]|uniref:pyridoxamine 5'-phosphate oxidase family protein n=1 Tax=Litoreibacter sp. TaxID=1969459 RepID=UPI0032993311
MAHGTKLNGRLRDFIEAQNVFFVATAAEDGTVNLSPKGADSLRILDDNRILWLNLTGSGNETAGHLRRKNRMTLMFCAFDDRALILRLYGTAQTLHSRDAGWNDAISQFPDMAGSRQIFDFKFDQLQTSCGTGVPVMPFKRDRVDDELLPFYAEMEPKELDAFWRKKNATTVDGFDTGLFED